MLSTLCSFKSSSPALLNDVRIVIIDRPTFEVFLNVFHREQQSLDKAYNNIASLEILKPATSQYSQSADNPPLPDFPARMPGHVQPISYSCVVIQQPLTTGRTNHFPSNNNEVKSTNLSEPSSTGTPNMYPILQLLSDDPLDHANKHEEISDEQHGASHETSSKDRVVLIPKQKHTSMTLHPKHSPLATKASLQKEQNSKITDESKKTKENKNEKTDGKFIQVTLCSQIHIYIGGFNFRRGNVPPKK